MTNSDEDGYEDDYYYAPEPIESWCDDCQEFYTDYWCELCGYHGHH